MTDIDLDFGDRDQILKLIQHIPASQLVNMQLKKHNSGVYVTHIPCDGRQGFSSLDYQTAERRGYIKLDFLNVSVYQQIQDPDHYQRLLDRSPNWNRLWTDPSWAKQLIHVGGHVDLLKDMQPDSIPRMAAFISIIRPGKAHLQRQPWSEVFKSVWDGDNSRGFIFKKAHAIGYSMLVTLHMNLLEDYENQS